MSAGRYAAADGSFLKSARGALARGVALIAVAVVIGILLLEASDPPDSLADPSTVATSATTGASGDASTSAPPGSDDPAVTGSTAGDDPSFDAGSVTVLVANGSAVPGAATRLSATLEASGYSVAPPADTPEDVTASVVYFAEGFQEAAAAVAGSLTPAPSVAALTDPPPVSAGDLGDAEVVVVMAADVAENA